MESARQRDLTGRFTEWKVSCSRLAARKAAHISRLQTWERRLDELIGLQDAEAQRLGEVASAQRENCRRWIGPSRPSTAPPARKSMRKSDSCANGL